VISLDIDVAGQQITGTTTISATATQDLSRFDLDLLGLTVSAIRVDGSAATFARDGRELQVTPAAAIAKGSTFKVDVDYRGTPMLQAVPGLPDLTSGWVWHDGGSYVLAEPDAASTWFPTNDHPSDKATYQFSITAPTDLQVAANGTLTSHEGDVWTYDESDPMASYLATVVVDRLTFTSDPGPNGVTIRNAFPTSVAAAATRSFAVQADMLAYLSTVFGPYPFPVYGAVLAPGIGGAALECQTLSLFDEDTASGGADDVILHELAHQWFGDSVSVANWSEIWLAEGFATYAEWLWSEHTGGQTAAQLAQRTYQGRQWSHPGAPGREEMFGGGVYQRGALTLQALRVTIGDDAFFGTLQDYAAAHKGGVATTADFEAAAEKHSGQDLHAFFQQWLYADAMPALPS